CDGCIQSEKKCHPNNKGKECEKCKEKCSKYKDFVNKWKGQYDLQAKAYEELYKKIEDGTSNYISDNDNYVVDFLKEVKTACGEDDTKSAEKYLYKTSNCKHYKFNDESTNSNKTYAFKEQPEGYESKCACEITHHPLDECPYDTNKEVCSRFQVVKRCMKKDFNNDLDNWNSYGVEDFKGKNAGVLVPPRRRHICFTNMITKQYEKQKNGMENFKTDLLQVAYNEGYFLCENYDKDPRDVLEAMKYTFADIADIVKGKDMINKDISTKLGNLLNNMVEPRSPIKWWRKNKTHVWNAMLCGYQKAGGEIEKKDCELPTDYSPDQFLRWFQEWTEIFCKRKKELEEEAQNQCNNITCDKDTGRTNSICAQACKNYSNFILIKKNEYQSLNSQYDMNYKKILKHKSAPQYFKDKYNSKCDCLSKHTDNEKYWKEPYDTFDDKNIKDKCDCQKPLPPPPPPPPEESRGRSEDHHDPLAPAATVETEDNHS
ncbi:hypothetical protein PFTANZ_06384, partial [Plasmodium falciparum Tanzania (2000708)]